MKTINTCCGSYVRRNSKEIKTPLPPNPKVNDGVNVIYIGSGNTSFKGNGTGSTYYASDHHRHFKVFKDDVKSVLKNRDIILKP